VALKFGGCTAFTPCDTPVDGSYKVTGGCIEDPLAPFKKQCPGLVQKSVSGTISGTVTLAAGNVTRDITTKFNAKVTVPAACTQGFPCSFVGPAIQSQVPGSTASCTGATDCDCDISLPGGDKSSSTFTQTGGSITTGGGDTYDVCKTGEVLQYEQTGGSQPQPGIYELTEK
jgi:hypothetical protein